MKEIIPIIEEQADRDATLYTDGFKTYDGLAKSSRNVYLSQSERAEVPMIYGGLVKLSNFAQTEKNSEKLKEFLRKYYLTAKCFLVEYIAITDSFAREIEGEISQKDVLVSLAVRTTQSKTRLIDNIILTYS